MTNEKPKFLTRVLDKIVGESAQHVDDFAADAITTLLDEAEGLANVAEAYGATAEQRVELMRDLNKLRKHEDRFQAYSRFGFTILTAGVVAGEHERSIYEFLEYRASFEERQAAILGESAVAAAREAQRQAAINDVISVLEAVGTTTLSLIAWAALEVCGFNFMDLDDIFK